MTTRLLGLAAAAAIGVAGAASAFPDKEITLLIPYGPGGGFDTISRKLAPKLEEALGVEVVPTNMPGANGRKAATYMMRQPADGHTIMIFNIPGHGLGQIRGEEMGYDITEVTWLGQVGQDGYVVLSAADNDEIRTFDDVAKLGRTIKIPDQGPSSTSHMANQITWSTVGVPFEFISGYKSSRDYTTAVLRGDGDLTMVVSGSAARYNADNDFNVLAEFSDNKQFPDAPDGEALGHPDLNVLGLRRVLGGPPAMPDDVVETWSNAIIEAVEDPEIQAWAQETGNPMPALGAGETEAAVERTFDFFSKFADVM